MFVGIGTAWKVLMFQIFDFFSLGSSFSLIKNVSLHQLTLDRFAKLRIS